jgi:putative transport protein
MHWFLELFSGETIASSVLILGLVAAAGLALGSLRAFGISLGIAGVLFSGLFFGHYHVTINQAVLEFAREFGLILFVYTIGIQVGPGFLSSLRREGLPLNLMAAAIVLLGVLITVMIAVWGGVEAPVAVGLFSGGTTNTPSLAAAQAALKQVPGYTDGMSKLPGLGYAVAYPFGILGIIITMLFTRVLFRINQAREAKELDARLAAEMPAVARMNLEVTNPNLEGVAVRDMPAMEELGVVISRIMRASEVDVAHPGTKLALGDILLAVGPKEALDEFRVIVGRPTDVDLYTVTSSISPTRIVVTKKEVLGKSVAELGLEERYEVKITRLRRAGVDLPAGAGVRLQFGDSVLVVGDPEHIQQTAAVLGNSTKRLDHPELIPVFVGITLGVILGSWPITIPGIPAPVKLGLAGGPLLVAIVLSRIHRIGPLVWFMPPSANFIMREIGIVLFLACVGLNAGDRFIETLTDGDGLYWMGLATLITFAPLLIVAVVARVFMKQNYLSLCGMLAGSMTDPPALAFAVNMNDSDAPTVAYATVYPLTMILRVIAAQVMILALMR